MVVSTTCFNLFILVITIPFEGYSWKTNQVGLGLDTIVRYELVKPDGKIVKVTKQSDTELFFGLKVIYFSRPFSD